MVTAPRPESRNRRRSRNATTTTTSAGPSRTSRTVVTGVRVPGRISGSAEAQALSPAARSRDWARRAASSGLRARRASSARLSASRARATSISVEISAVSARIDTPRSVIDRKPPCAATIDVLAGVGADGHDAALGELAEQRGVTGQDTELALGRAGDDHRRLAGPDLPLDGHQLDLQGRHDTPRDPRTGPSL